MNDKLMLVIKKEYFERVKSRAFVIGTALGPILIAIMMFGPAVLAERTEVAKQTLLVVDRGDGVATEKLTAKLESARQQAGESFPLTVEFEAAGADFDEEAAREVYDERVTDGDLDGYVILSGRFMRNGRATYYGKTISGAIGSRVLEEQLDAVYRESRMLELGLPAADLAEIMRGVTLDKRSIGGDGQQDVEQRTIMAIGMIMLLYMMMILYGQFTMSAVIEDKSSRVVEVMLASVTPNQLMIGKVLGQGAVGFSQFLIWGAAGAVFTQLGGNVAGMEIDLAQAGAVAWAWFGVFFVLGFLMYSAMYAGVGALCSSMQDAQNYQFPIMAMIIIPMLMLAVAMKSPDSGPPMILSLIPFFTPILMFIRVMVGDPALWQVILSIVLLAVTVVVLMRVAGKLFRMSILHFGKAPSWGEVLRMLRAPD